MKPNSLIKNGQGNDKVNGEKKTNTTMSTHANTHTNTNTYLHSHLHK